MTRRRPDLPPDVPGVTHPDDWAALEELLRKTADVEELDLSPFEHATAPYRFLVYYLRDENKDPREVGRQAWHALQVIHALNNAESYARETEQTRLAFMERATKAKGAPLTLDAVDLHFLVKVAGGLEHALVAAFEAGRNVERLLFKVAGVEASALYANEHMKNLSANVKAMSDAALRDAATLTRRFEAIRAEHLNLTDGDIYERIAKAVKQKKLELLRPMTPTKAAVSRRIQRYREDIRPD